jgi:hypothetical protein
VAEAGIVRATIGYLLATGLGVSIGDGIVLRVVLLVLCMAAMIWFTLRYAKRVKADPSASLVVSGSGDAGFVEDNEDLELEPLTGRHRAVIALVAFTFALLTFSMGDALVLADESDCDAVVDIATVTGSAVRALGADMAAVLGTDQGVIEQVKAAAQATDEPVWQMPLWAPYRRKFDRSSVADLPNIASDDTPDVIASSLFLSHFVGDTPWAHIDIAGPAQNDEGRTWHPVGCTGFGARLLTQLAVDFEPTR